MCGRYTLRSNQRQIAEAFELLHELEDLKPRYNIAPTQMVPAVKLVNGKSSLHDFAKVNGLLSDMWTSIVVRKPRVGNRDRRFFAVCNGLKGPRPISMTEPCRP